MFHLRGQNGQSIAIEKSIFRVGSHQNNDLIINDKSIAPMHAIFKSDNKTLLIEQSDRRAFSSINGQQIFSSAQILNGDTIQIGKVRFKITKEESFGDSDFTSAATLGSPTKGLSTNNINPRTIVLLLIVVGIFAMAFMGTEETNTKIASVKNAEKESPLNIDENKLRNNDIVPKELLSQQEILSENSFKRGLRDYFNQKYSRSIIHFDKALSENPGMEKAIEYRKKAVKKIKTDLESLLDDSIKSYRNHQFRRAKSQTQKILTILSEEIPGFNFKYLRKNAAGRRVANTPIQEEIVIKLPCQETSHTNICEKAKETMNLSRRKLGDLEVKK